ncbi:MAG: BNR-4 repeat-containing protein [Candidatus Omnitrophica bacterium]|nr:BNR-4 repeat-containing protein [Candidatus Omnitrophota bacterium]
MIQPAKHLRIGLFLISLMLAGFAWTDSEPASFPRADGYRGIWYSNQPSKDKYIYKYSGGLGTYCAKHFPHAIYAPQVNKTFFVFGGTKGVDEKNPLLIMASYYDHNTGLVPKPVIVMEKGTSDAHHNPVLCIDADGMLWIFASAHGGKDGFIWKSRKPFSIDSFEQILKKEFTYPQPVFMENFGISLFFTKYTGGRELYVNSSVDGFDPQKDVKLAGFGGHYQSSGSYGSKRATIFNWHPPKGGLNARTNLYYMESNDFGQTWTTVDGKPLTLPLGSPQNDALVRDYQKEGLLVYLKDLNFDEKGNPVFLHVVSRGYESGPENGPRLWMIAHWQGDRWEFKKVAASDHNYDMGSIYIEDDGAWRVIGPTDPGPQAFGTGGEMVMWVSLDRGRSWKKEQQLTQDSPRNHTYARRPLNAHPDFYAFWADGDAFKPSESQLYFTNRDGTNVWMLPVKMEEDFQKPVSVTLEKEQ